MGGGSGLIELKDVYKIYRTAGYEINAVNGVTLNIAERDIFGSIGFSGTGKSTLVRCINLL